MDGFRVLRLSVLAGALAVAGMACSQTPSPAKVDYAQDVAPILRQNCVSCHGPLKQNGGLRVDRRSSMFKSARRITPGNTANSFLYHRIIGEFGQPMPPTGDLKPEQVATIKAWIEQGAEWPDALANEDELPPVDPAAVAAIDALHRGDIAGFVKTAAARPTVLNARGPEGSTPFMYAALYADAAVLERLIGLGADVNRKNDAHATALLWAARDLPKTTVLVKQGADVNARSEDFRTPLMVAARKPGGAAIVKLLLEHGANPNPNEWASSQSSPLTEAATAGDAASFELLLDHGAEIKYVAETVLGMSVMQGCHRCFELAVAKVSDKDVYTGTLQDTAFVGDTAAVRTMLEHGADAKAYDGLGRTALMYAAASDVLPLDTVKLLVASGADVNAVSKHGHGPDEGQAPLDMALLHGKNAVADFLVASGAKPGSALGIKAAGYAPAALNPRGLDPRYKNEIRGAIQDSLPLLQRTDAVFAKNSGCVSCHSNSLTAMTVAAARRQGFTVDEKTAAAQVKVNVESLTKQRDQLHQGFLVPVGDNFSENVAAYVLLGLNAEGYEADIDTDAAAMFILGRQKPNGEWPYPLADTRQPLCLDHIGNTALALRALQLYAPKAQAVEYARAVELAAGWLATAKSYNNDDRGWRVAGLAWAGSDPKYRAALALAMKELVTAQAADGGWADLPSMESTAYATGKSMVALRLAGMPASHPVYKRGVAWLLKNQQKDGTWFVRSRAAAFQPWADAQFPYKYDQFISAAGTSWATMALTLDLPDGKSAVAANLQE